MIIKESVNTHSVSIGNHHWKSNGTKNRIETKCSKISSPSRSTQTHSKMIIKRNKNCTYAIYNVRCSTISHNRKSVSLSLESKDFIISPQKSIHKQLADVKRKYSQ